MAVSKSAMKGTMQKSKIGKNDLIKIVFTLDAKTAEQFEN